MIAGRREAEQNAQPAMTLAEERAAWETGALAMPLPAGARHDPVVAGGIPAEWMEMPDALGGRVVLLLHGGGYTSGSPITHRKLAASLSRAARARVLTPDYRLAPEHPFPAALEDAVAAYDWLRASGFAPGSIIMAGDSAGAGLAASTLIALHHAGKPLPGAVVLMSAWLDLTASSPSLETHKDVDLQITGEALRAAGRLYIGDGDPADPRASTLFADPTGLPPMLLQVGGDEVLLDDSRTFAERARAAGVDATLEVYEGMWHVFQFTAPEVPEAEAAIHNIAAFIRAQLGD
jgi:acetyl esterase/lipase